MAANLGLKVQPPPIRVTDMSAAEWSRWFMDLQRALTSAAVSVSWAGIDFTGSDITDLASHRHVDLQGLQGGTTGEFYHLTAAERTGLIGNTNYTQHFHDSDRDRTNHTGTQLAATISDFDTAADARVAAGLATLGTASVEDYTDGTWTPTFTGLTVVLGAGSVTYTGRYQQVGKLVKFTVTITPAGGATVAATAGVTYCDMGVPASFNDICQAANVTTKLPIGSAFIDATNDRIYTPAWTATGNTIVISGSYEA